MAYGELSRFYEQRLANVKITVNVFEKQTFECIDYEFKFEDVVWLFENYRKADTPVPEHITAEFVAKQIEAEFGSPERWMYDWCLMDNLDPYDDIYYDFDIVVEVLDERPNPYWKGPDVLFEEYRPHPTIGGFTKGYVFF